MPLKAAVPLVRALRFCRIPRAEKILFVEAWLTLAVVRAALAVLPLRRVIEASERLARAWRRPGPPADATCAAKRLAQAIRFSLASTCLSEAIAAHFVLCRRGIETDIRIGVDKTGSRFRAHAWVEMDGQAVVGSGISDGTAFTPLPPLRRFVA